MTNDIVTDGRNVNNILQFLKTCIAKTQFKKQCQEESGKKTLHTERKHYRLHMTTSPKPEKRLRQTQSVKQHQKAISNWKVQERAEYKRHQN